MVPLPSVYFLLYLLNAFFLDLYLGRARGRVSLQV